ncbi:hypothetical protein SAMN05216480_101140 [Pustulibacterium marinum]|uniref:Beta-carotene 15,15'-monooxygenase n=1 Tax=Pustulibacterium marinum TaxID=1224947 RepID=A0A1I7ETX4_9FLAO|nr:DUF6427 family protein [Pustulibacterium marinum]SFU27332.1 hypothetical protein SAMN05216480_101140 [Pustulibacterium marinum]
MISSFFSKTKPINYLVLVLLLLGIVVFKSFLFSYEPKETSFLIEQGLNLVLLLISFGLVVFIDSKNKLTNNNSYALLVFVLLFAFFPAVLTNHKLILSNVFVLLAYRRLISLKSMISTKAKIFDSVLWIGVAFFLFNWAFPLFILPFFGILFFQAKSFKNWMVPYIAALTLAIFYAVYLIYFQGGLMNFQWPEIEFAFNIEKYKTPQFMVPAAFLFIMGTWAVLQFFANFQSKSIKLQKPFWILILGLFASTIIALLSEISNGAEMIFMFFPLAILIGTVLERLRTFWLKELLLWIFIVAIPLVVLVL